MWHERQGESGEGFRSVDAATGEPFGPARAVDGHDQVRARCAEADAAFDDYRAIGNVERAAFLDRIGDEIFALGDGLIATAMRETGLPRSRLEGERGRTVGQLKMFAGVVRRGDWMGIRIDPALPDRAMPRPDLRMRMIPVGPVAVFGASNFPLAFSTAGGDTASALAAGCPVVVKGHPAHPATSALVADAVLKAVDTCDMPRGVFGHLAGPGDDLGAALVQNPCIAAIGFTGSRDGGLALMKLAQARAVPIPVYAEMSSINPVILLPAALAAHSAELADSFVASLTTGAGQFCTNPGLLLAIEGAGLDAFVTAASKAVAQTEATTMLTGGIHAVYDWGVAALGERPGVRALARGRAVEGHARGRAALFETRAESFLTDPALRHEMFGAASLIVRCRDAAQLREVLTDLEGQLTATMHMDEADTGMATTLLPLLERKAGRILINGWPTGVEVTHAMVHGGPFPATSDVRTTSVGSLAIDRFLRPVCYQNLPSTLLPAVLRDDAAGAPSIGD